MSVLCTECETVFEEYSGHDCDQEMVAMVTARRVTTDLPIAREQLIVLIGAGLVRCKSCGRPATRRFLRDYEGDNGISTAEEPTCANPACVHPEARLKSEKQAPYGQWLTTFIASLSEEEMALLDEQRDGKCLDYFWSDALT